MSDSRTHKGPVARTSPWDLAVGPPPERWDDWVELDPRAWPEKRERHFACAVESGVGLITDDKPRLPV